MVYANGTRFRLCQALINMDEFDRERLAPVGSRAVIDHSILCPDGRIYLLVCEETDGGFFLTKAELERVAVPCAY